MTTTTGRRAILATAILACSLAPALAAPKVAVDIAPVHAIVARVMAGAGEPELIVPPGASPHDHALRPSEAATLDDAEIVFWIGPGLTGWMADPITTLASDARVVALGEAEGIAVLPVRTGGPFEADAHDHAEETSAEDEDEHEHEHAGEEDHADEAVHDEHAGEADHDEHVGEHAGETDDEAQADDHADEAQTADIDHDDGAHDPHVWLDPLNAAVIADGVAVILGEADPANAETYAANAAAFGDEMAALIDEVAAQLAPVRDRPFIVFHDAYQYFETRFDMPAAGSIALQESVPPGAARVAEIRDRVRSQGIVCGFSEPQFEPALLGTVTEGTEVALGTLDPIGADLTPGPELYPALLRLMASSLASCLAG